MHGETLKLILHFPLVIKKYDQNPPTNI